MNVVYTIDEIRALRAEVAPVQTLGFVPTMGYLHAGHISLVELARSQNEIVAVSIFVNPTQFGPNEDFNNYPRDTDRDLAMLYEAGADWVFMPSIKEIYPDGFSTYVHVREVTSRLEGAARPGH